MQPLFISPMASCYILYSERIDSYYIGSTTESISTRLARHNDLYYPDKWTSKGVPWVLYLSIECQSIKHASSIESHIKRMKSRKYIENLKRYPEMMNKLIHRYSESPDC